MSAMFLSFSAHDLAMNGEVVTGRRPPPSIDPLQTHTNHLKKTL